MNLTNLLLMNLFEQNFISTCTISLRKADSPAERNHPNRKNALKGRPERFQAGKQTMITKWEIEEQSMLPSLLSSPGHPA